MATPTARLELRLSAADQEALDQLIAMLPPGSTRTSAIRTAVAEALSSRRRFAELRSAARAERSGSRKTAAR